MEIKTPGNEQPEQPEQPEQIDQPAHQEHPEQPEELEQLEQIEQPVEPGELQHSEQSEQSEKSEQPGQPEHFNQLELSEQPQPEKKPAKKRILYSNLLRRLLILVFVAIFLFSLVKLVTKLYAYYKEDNAYEQIRASIQSAEPAFAIPTQEPADAEGETDPSAALGATVNTTSPSPLPYTVFKGDPDDLNPEGILKVYSALKAQNSDLVGWISMPGFRKVIDYPVMQGKDNDFYLTHDFYKNKSYSGSIYMDAANINTEPGRNIILYGHAMKDMSMFGNLKDYSKDAEKYGKNTIIYLDLLNTRLEYRVFSVYSTESTFNYRRTAFTDDADFLNFLETIKGKSEHDFGVSMSPQDKIITLSTCDESYGTDGRTVIHAKLIKQMIYDGSGIEGDYANAAGESDKKIISSNVYLDKMLLQYQVPDPNAGKNNVPAADASQIPGASPSPAASGAPGATPTPNASGAPGATPTPNASEIPSVSPSPKASQVPGASPSPGKGKSDKNSPVRWKDVVLDPPFMTTGKVYSAKVPTAADTARLTVTAADPKAGISYTLNGKAADPNKLPLTEGDNEIIIRVVSVGGNYVRTYTIHVLRETSPTPSPSPSRSPTPQPPSAAPEPKASAPAATNQP